VGGKWANSHLNLSRSTSRKTCSALWTAALGEVWVLPLVI
jgi:hypothetical protein